MGAFDLACVRLAGEEPERNAVMAQLRGDRQCRGVAEAEVEHRGADLVPLLGKPAHQLGAAEPRFDVQGRGRNPVIAAATVARGGKAGGAGPPDGFSLKTL